MMIALFNRNLFGLNKRLNPLKNSYRFVKLELPDLEQERLLKRIKINENFDEIFPQIKLPFKLRRTPEESREFIRLRLEQYPNGFEPITLDKYKEIWFESNDPDVQKKIIDDIKMILVYYNEILRLSLFAPSTISVEDMRIMIFKYNGHGNRLRYVNFIFIREFDTWNRAKQEQEASNKRRQEELENYFEHIGCFDPQTNQLQYGYWRNTLFTRYYHHARHLQTIKLLHQAQQFGQPLIIDCSLEQQMADYEILSCIRQISKIYHSNRYSRYPFKLLFTGFDMENNRTYKYLRKNMSEFLDKPEFYFNLYSKSYQELLPNEEKQRLIYLSPDARKLMVDFDPNACYIIGALVSKTNREPLTLRKAISEQIECLRLPIHQYVQLKPLVKRTLSFSGTFQILLELKHGKDWRQALINSIPNHKISS